MQRPLPRGSSVPLLWFLLFLLISAQATAAPFASFFLPLGTTSTFRRSRLFPAAFLDRSRRINVALRGGSQMSPKNEDSGSGGGVGDAKPISSAAEDAAAYNAFASASVDITGAYARNGLVTVTRSARDLDGNSRRSFLYHIPYLSQTPQQHAPPAEVPIKVKARVPSPSGDKVAILVEEPTAKNGEDAKPDGDKRFAFEIWADGGHSLVNRIVLPKELHGKVCTDMAWFGAISWNANETALVYCAEANSPKTRSFFDDDKAGKLSGDGEKERGGGGAAAAIAGGQHTLGLGKGEDWGEKYTGTSRLALFCVHVGTGKVGAVTNVPGGPVDSSTEGGFSLGQPVFSPCGKAVVYVGWDAGGGGCMPKRLGSIYCYQRHCKLYSSGVTKLLDRLSSNGETTEEENSSADYDCLTPNDRLARSPRISKPVAGNSKLVFLCSNDGFDTHGGCMALHSLEWDLKREQALPETRTVLVKEVKLPSDSNDADKVGNLTFPGLFVNQLPDDCFTKDGKAVLMTSQWGSVSKIIKISLEDGTFTPTIFDLTGKGRSFASQSILCMTEEGGAIVSQSEPSSPALLGYVSSEPLLGAGKDVECRLLSKMPIISATAFDVSATHQSSGDTFTYDVINMNPPHGDVEAPVQCILLMPHNPTDELLPLIVVPHGGPHSCTSTNYVPSYAYLCSHGNYAILHVNYRGSSGFGQAALESLAGTAGSLDVKDVVHAARRTVEMSSSLDPQRVGICGGSHGGYLAGHCIGQYPELFRVAAMRNPVTNIATMVSQTDIPDWCYVETFGPGSYSWNEFRGPDKDDLGKMWDASPIAHVANARAPTLVALGMSDRRVPSSQGLEFYHQLRSKGIETKLLVYDKDDHAIDRVASEADHWINIKRWFDEHL